MQLHEDRGRRWNQLLIGLAILAALLPAATVLAPPPGNGNGGGNGGGGGGNGSGGDTTPPGAVADLMGVSATHRGVTLSWTATGDDGTNGTATSYDLRYAFAPITESTWDLAYRAPEPTPGPPGTIELVEVGHLTPGQDHYFAVKVIDDRENVSALSNVALVPTAAPPPTPWTIEPVLAAGQSGAIHLSVDPVTDTPTIAFMHRFTTDVASDLRFAWWTGTAWQHEIIPTEAYVEGTDHDHGPDGTPYIATRGSTKFLQSINLTWHDGTQWVTEYVDQMGISAKASLAVDPDGNPSLVYWRRWEPNGPRHPVDEVVLATRVDGIWQYETIAADTIARDVSLQYHPQTGLPVIAYGEDGSDGTPLTLTWFDGQAWQSTLVPLDQSSGLEMALDPLTGTDVYSPPWPAGLNASLVIMPDGAPGVAHRTRLTPSAWIYLFSRRDLLTGTWVQEEIDVSGYVGGYRPSLDVTASGELVLAFSRNVENSDEDHLYLARRAGN
jgi:hypothetical protein